MSWPREDPSARLSSDRTRQSYALILQTVWMIAPMRPGCSRSFAAEHPFCNAPTAAKESVNSKILCPQH